MHCRKIKLASCKPSKCPSDNRSRVICYPQRVPPHTTAPRPLELRPLGRTGLKVTALGLGCAPLGDLFQKLTEQQADGVIQEALSQGIRLFDTAPWFIERRPGNRGVHTAGQGNQEGVS